MIAALNGYEETITKDCSDSAAAFRVACCSAASSEEREGKRDKLRRTSVLRQLRLWKSLCL